MTVAGAPACWRATFTTIRARRWPFVAASPRIAHNVFTPKLACPSACRASVIVDEQAPPQFSGNVFHGISRDTFGRLSDGVRSALARDNWFRGRPDRSAPPAGAAGRRGR